MDHAIADSHATVTISHRAIRSHQTPHSSAMLSIPPIRWTEGALPGLLVLFWHEEWAMGARARVSAIRHA